MEKSREKKHRIPGRTPEARENELISLAVDLAEKKLRDGTATSQIISQLLNLATTKHQLELKKLESETQAAYAKIKQIEDQESSKELYERAINAFKEYQGVDYYDE